MKSTAVWLAAGALTMSGCPAFGQAAQELPLEMRGYRIIARGTIEGGHEVRMLIDTGTSCSVIDRRLASELKLQKMLLNNAVNAHGRLFTQSWVLVHDIRLGPITTSRTCATADIPLPQVQMIIGLDILRRHNLTIDMESRKLVFDSTFEAEAGLPFDPDSPRIIVAASLEGREIRLILDTGAERPCLYGRKISGRLSKLSSKSQVELTGMSGALNGSEVYLRDLTIGRDRWDSVRFLIIQSPGSAAAGKAATDAPWDGILAPGPLGIKRIHLDFRQGQVKWSR
ncbi:MAG: hypothetical protein FJW35_14060 [Acidobacteria bacterium]|nr:hypothetical protein [Acidobacteriota bacterium]